MEKKKKTMQDYIELTPDMIRKNVQKNEELTKVLVDEFNRDHFDSILIWGIYNRVVVNLEKMC